MLDTEWEYYENNRDELVEKYCGKHVVISGNKVVAAFDDRDVAYSETVKTIPLGSFMIHHSFQIRNTIQPDNSYLPYSNNRSGYCWQ